MPPVAHPSMVAHTVAADLVLGAYPDFLMDVRVVAKRRLRAGINIEPMW